MNRPTLSVIVPNYNHGRFLSVCLDALLSQSISATEIIVIDDASTDDSMNVIQSYASRYPSIAMVRDSKNQGVVWGMNHGLRIARSDYVLFAAADDQVLPGLFEKSLDLLARHPYAALCCAIGAWHEQATGFNWQVGVGMSETPAYLSPQNLVQLERQNKLFIASHTAIIRLDALIQIGGFLPELRWHCDWFAIYAAAFRHGICFVPEPLGRFNICNSSFYKTGRRDDKAHRAVLGRILELLMGSEFENEGRLMREAGSLFQFAGPMLSLMLHDPRYRSFITPTFLRKNLVHSFKLAVKDSVPIWAANLYFRLAGYRISESK